MLLSFSRPNYLDAGIIDCTLSGLEHYPKAAVHFEKALTVYLSGDTSQYRNLLDDLRFSFEQLLKSIFRNEKSLENQKTCLLSWLKKDKELHKQVVNLYGTLISNYARYQNDAVKHKEDFSIDEVEFMIYLTGNFMRLVIHLANSPKDDTRP